MSDYIKKKIKRDKEIYYFDHHGKPQRSFCTDIKEQGNWKLYEIAGVPSFKFEGDVYASKQDMIHAFNENLAKLR